MWNISDVRTMQNEIAPFRLKLLGPVRPTHVELVDEQPLAVRRRGELDVACLHAVELRLVVVQADRLAACRGAGHHEGAWAARVEPMLRFLFPPPGGRASAR